MKLELKHIAPYLPYGLKTVNFNVGKLLDKPLISEVIASNIMCFTDGTTESKIILRPLSDLTKEIEVNGKKFVPLTELLNISNFDVSKMSWEEQLDYGHIYCDLSFINFYDLQLLLEWHFDVFGLIDENLAININTLND